MQCNKSIAYSLLILNFLQMLRLLLISQMFYRIENIMYYFLLEFGDGNISSAGFLV